jgi:hypothetical protein
LFLSTPKNPPKYTKIHLDNNYNTSFGCIFKLALAGGDISQGRQPWAVSSPPTVIKGKRQLELRRPFFFRCVKTLFVAKQFTG